MTMTSDTPSQAELAEASSDSMTPSDWLRAIAAWCPDYADHLDDAADHIDELERRLPTSPPAEALQAGVDATCKQPLQVDAASVAKVEIKEYIPRKIGVLPESVMIWVNDRDTTRGGYCLECVPREVAPRIVASLSSAPAQEDGGIQELASASVRPEPGGVEPGWALVPIEPTPELLRSMAIRYDHGLGVAGYYDQPVFGAENVGHAKRLEATIRTMRQLHEEVVGTGFYRAAVTPPSLSDSKATLSDAGSDAEGRS